MESTAVGSYRLKVRLGTHEFDADGPETSVKEQFELFLAAVNSVGPMQPAANGKKSEKPEDDEEEASGDFDAIWDRAYLRQDDRISLKLLPQTKTQSADAILLIMYGYQMLQKQESVQSIALMEAAQQSGIRIDRIDRNIPASHRVFVIKGGSGKGSRYTLNNRGLAQAQSLLEAMFE